MRRASLVGMYNKTILENQHLSNSDHLLYMHNKEMRLMYFLYVIECVLTKINESGPGLEEQ